MVQAKIFFFKLEAKILSWFSPFLPDRYYLKRTFRHRMGYPLNLNNPRTFNEKLQWLKLNNRNPEYTRMVDKVAAKKIVASIIGKEYVIPTIAIYDSVEEINLSILPEKFVLKCSHDSGGVIVCRNKADFDLANAKKILSQKLRHSYYLHGREYPYKDVPRRILAEMYMEDESGYELRDYKFLCYNGICRNLYVCTDRSKNEPHFDYFDCKWNHLPFECHGTNAKICPCRPKNLNEMIHVAERIAKAIKSPFVRIDLYNVNEKIYFGEITFFSFNGMEPFKPRKWDYIFGDMIRLDTLNS